MKPNGHQSEPNEEPDGAPDGDEPCGCHDEPEPRARSRWVHAWRVLRGHELSNVQLQAEWLEYKLIFNDILSRFSAQLARNAKVEKKRIVKQLELDVPAPPAVAPVGPRDKSELRRRAAAMRGIQFPQQNGGDHP